MLGFILAALFLLILSFINAIASYGNIRYGKARNMWYFGVSPRLGGFFMTGSDLFNLERSKIKES